MSQLVAHRNVDGGRTREGLGAGGSASFEGETRDVTGTSAFRHCELLHLALLAPRLLAWTRRRLS